MRYKPKDKKTTILIITIAILAVMIAKSLGFSSTRSATRILYTTSEGRSDWSASYVLLDGTMQKTLYPENGVLTVAVETESGTISIEMKDAAGNLVFDRENIGTDSFTVEVSGKTVVHIEAVNHKGSFNISG